MIRNISIATVYDIIIDDVSIYSVDLFTEIVILNTVSVVERNAIISGYVIFFSLTCFLFRELINGHCIFLAI